MNLSWRDIRLDGLYDAPFDGQEVVKTTLSTRNVRATSYREAGLRVRDAETGELSAALGAEFLPDQSGQLMVLVLAADGEELGLSHSQALDVLAAASAGDAIRQLGAGVLRFDRGLVTPQASPELFGWLAEAVVRLLRVEPAGMDDGALAELLGVTYEPREPGDEFERPVAFVDEVWAAPVVEEAPVEAPDAAEPWAASEEWAEEATEEPAAEVETFPAEAEDVPTDEAELWAGFEEWEAEELAEEPVPEPEVEPWTVAEEPAAEVEAEPAAAAEAEPLDEAQLEMIRLLTEDVEEGQTPVWPADEAAGAREDIASIAREEIGDDAVDLLSDDDLALLVAALRGMGAEPAEGEEPPPLEEEYGPLPSDYSAMQEWGAPAGERREEPETAAPPEEDWLADYESLLESEAEPEASYEADIKAEDEVEETAAGDEIAEAEPEPAPEPEWLEEGEVEAEPEPEWVEPGDDTAEAEPELPSEAAWVEAGEAAPPEPEWIELAGEETAAGPEVEPEAEAEPDWIREGSVAFQALTEPETFEAVEEPAEETWPEPAAEYAEEPLSAPPAAPEEEVKPAESAFRAGPVPLADFGRAAQRPAETPVMDETVELGETAAPGAGLEEARYEYPPPVQERQLAGKQAQFYQCASCGEFSAEQVGENTYRCFRCRTVIEYRFGERPHRAIQP